MKFKLLFFVLCFFLFSCSEEVDPLWATTATIIENPQSSDNECQWLILADGETFRPSHLNIQYRQPQLKVFIKAEILSTTSNCEQGQAFREIRLEQISLDN
mgnify:CR=1 FL=1